MTYPWTISRSVPFRWPLIARYPVYLRLVLQRKHDSKFIVCHLTRLALVDVSYITAALTLSTGVNPDPESVPHADGVKLCEPTYA